METALAGLRVLWDLKVVNSCYMQCATMCCDVVFETCSVLLLICLGICLVAYGG